MSTKAQRQCEAATGMKLRAYMKHAHALSLTQTEIAEKIGVKQSLVSYWASQFGLVFPRNPGIVYRFRGETATQKGHCQRYGIPQGTVYARARRNGITFLAALELVVSKRVQT